MIWTSTAQYRPFPMDLHHSWGGPFAVEKMYFLVDKVVRNRSIWGPCQFLNLSPSTSWKTSLSIFRPLFFPSSYYLAFLITVWRGASLSFDEAVYHRHILCMCVCNLISRNGLNQYCSTQAISHGSLQPGVPWKNCKVLLGEELK